MALASLPLFRKAGKNETLALHFSDPEEGLEMKWLVLELLKVGLRGKRDVEEEGGE